MRVGFFSPTILNVGGGEWVTLNMINALAAKKHEIIVYSAKKINHESISRFFGHDLTFHREVLISPNFFNPYDLENIYPNLAKSYMFSKTCNFLIDSFSNSIFPWVDAVYFNGRPKVTQLPGGRKGFIFVPYEAIIRRSLKRYKDGQKTLMACSRFLAGTIEGLTGLKTEVLYPPVSGFFGDGLNVSLKSDTVVTVTRISNDKRPETIPLIAKLLPDDISFVIIGSCRLSGEVPVLKKLQKCIHSLHVEDRVKLLLNVSREKQREVLQSSKVYLHPLVPYEAFGISVVEAMSAGCVPVAPDIAGLREIVPSQLRYTTIEEAASKVRESLTNWSPVKADEFVKIADKFNQTEFNRNFLKITGL